MSGIAFHFQPQGFDDNLHVVEKASPGGGGKRRYLIGVSSGLKHDGHGERMTDRCIKSFMDQANSGDILLYAGKHDVDFTDDVGILTKAEILPSGDWNTEYRLYDEADGVGPLKLEKADTLWKQMNGLPPYTKKKGKGFSIEGSVPDGGIKHVTKMGDKNVRVLDDVVLDGVVVVPRPSYKDSVAHAVYKTLDAVSPWSAEKTVDTYRNTIEETVAKGDAEDSYHSMRFKYDDALERVVKGIMTDSRGAKRDRVDLVYREHSGLMSDLVMKCGDMFTKEDEEVVKEEPTPRGRGDIFREMQAQVDALITSLKNKLNTGE